MIEHKIPASAATRVLSQTLSYLNLDNWQCVRLQYRDNTTGTWSACEDWHQWAIMRKQMLAPHVDYILEVHQSGPAALINPGEPGQLHPDAADSPLTAQVGGDHYKSLAIQPVEYIHQNKIPYLDGNVIKYTTRHASKNGIQDLRKAQHYLQLMAEAYYKEKL